MTDFVTKFYNLEGFTIGERQRNLYALLKDQAVLDHQDDIVQNLKPRNYLERQFQIEIFMFLRRTKELLKVVEDGDEIFLSKIIKQPWFIKVFGDVDVEEFVNKYLLGLSYSSRMKLLKQLCANLPEEKIDLLFDALLTKYGLLIAKQFLSYCSTDKIRRELQTHEITLHPGHLRQFFLKDPELVALYIEECDKRREEKFSDRKFLRFVAEKNLDFFLRLVKKFNLVAPLGRRTTKKITKVRKEDVLNDSEFYVGVLKASKVPRSLQKDFRRFYLNIFPRDIEEVSNFWYYNRYLPYIPKKLRYPLLSDTFYTIYKSKLEDDEELIYNESFLHLMHDSDPELCDKYASIKYHETKDESYLRCMLTDKALAILKARFNRSLGMLDKRRYVESMVRVCAFKKDLKGLEDVMDFFSGKQKSVDNNIRNEFLTAVCGQFSMDDFTEKHWSHLKNIMDYHVDQGGYFRDALYYNYLEYLHRNGKPTNRQLDVYVRHQIKGRVYLYHKYMTYKVPEVMRMVIVKLIEEIPLQAEEDHEYEDVRIMVELVNFNEKNPDKMIDMCSYPRLVEVLMTKDDFDWEYLNVVQKLICQKSRNDFELKLMEYYFDKIQTIGNQDIILWFFKNDLKQFIQYFSKIAHLLVSDKQINIWRNIKKYSHLKLDEMAISYLVNKLSNEENPREKVALISPLVNIQSVEDFVQCTAQYIPKSGRIDLQDYDQRDLVMLQYEIARMYKKCRSMKLVIPSLLKYCIGDYLDVALPSLYSALYRIPEKDVPEIVETLMNGAVSVRKHALFLVCALLDQKSVLDMFRKLAEQDKNVSIKKQMYSSIVRYFRNHPIGECWELAESYINFVDKADEESLKSFSQYKIPVKYRYLYWQTVWRFLESNRSNILNVSKYMDKHLSNTEDLILKLPSSLSRTVIENYFLNDATELGKLHGILKYTSLFLLHDTNIDNFQFVFDFVEKRKNSGMVLDFYKEFVALNDNEKFTVDAVEMFFSEWFKVFTPIETFHEFLMLKGFIIYKANGTDLIQLSRGFVELIEDTIELYSAFILEKVNDCLEYFVGLMFSDRKKDKLQFINYLEDYKKTDVTTVVCLHLCDGLTKYERKKCCNLLMKIAHSREESVKIIYNSWVMMRDEDKEENSEKTL